MKNIELTVDISKTKDFNDFDVEDIKNSLKGMGRVTTSHYIMRSEFPPAYLIFFIGFVMGQILSGFFQAIGKDLHRKAKKYFSKEDTIKSVVKAFSKIDNERKGIVFVFRTNKTEIRFNSDASNEFIIKDFLNNFPGILKITNKEGFQKDIENKNLISFDFLSNGKWYISAIDLSTFKRFEYIQDIDEWEEIGRKKQF